MEWIKEVMGEPNNAVFWLNFLCIIGFVFDLWLVGRDTRKKFADPSFAPELNKQKKHFWWNSFVGFIANFFDTFGIRFVCPLNSNV